MSVSKKLFTLSCSLSLMFLLQACDNSQSVNKEMEKKVIVKQSEAQSFVDAGNNEEASNLYTRLGEIMVLPEGITHSLNMFEKALKANPKNERANFYLAILKPLSLFEGVEKRFKGVLTSKEQQRLETAVKEVEKKNILELVSFLRNLPSNKKSINTHYEIQKFIKDEVLAELNKSVERLDKAMNSEFEININLARLGLRTNTQTTDETYESNDCFETSENGWECHYYYSYIHIENSGDVFKADNFKVDKADLRVLRNYFSAIVNYLRLVTAFSIDEYKETVEAIVNRVKELERDLTEKEIVEILNDHRNFLVLHRDNELHLVSQNLSDVLTDTLDLSTMGNEICKNIDRERNLIANICLNDEDIKDMQETLNFLAGPRVIDLDNKKKVKILIDITALLNDAPGDLKDLLPTEFDEDGKALQFADPTLRGLFPKGDLLTKLRQIGRK